MTSEKTEKEKYEEVEMDIICLDEEITTNYQAFDSETERFEG